MRIPIAATLRIVGGVVGISATNVAVAYVGDCATAATLAVQVVVDLDPVAPGFQSNLNVPEGTTVIEGVAVYVIDPTQSRCVFGIGYLGGLDRGIALGHMPANVNQGAITGLNPTIGASVNPGNSPWVDQVPFFDPAFVGPEVQYYEAGAEMAAVISAEPEEPIFVVDVELLGAAAGDVFDLFLADNVVIWTEGEHGAFSTLGFQTLDTGGDSVPDQTSTIYGLDPDASITVPPATFLVDYIDGPPEGGPATITVVPLGDLDGDGSVGITDLFIMFGSWGACPSPCPPSCLADLDDDCFVGITDLFIMFGNWG